MAAEGHAVVLQIKHVFQGHADQYLGFHNHAIVLAHSMALAQGDKYVTGDLVDALPIKMQDQDYAMIANNYTEKLALATMIVIPSSLAYQG